MNSYLLVLGFNNRLLAEVGNREQGTESVKRELLQEV
jgi:hypothetical protein